MALYFLPISEISFVVVVVIVKFRFWSESSEYEDIFSILIWIEWIKWQSYSEIWTLIRYKRWPMVPRMWMITMVGKSSELTAVLDHFRKQFFYCTRVQLIWTWPHVCAILFISEFKCPSNFLEFLSKTSIWMCCQISMQCICMTHFPQILLF